MSGLPAGVSGPVRVALVVATLAAGACAARTPQPAATPRPAPAPELRRETAAEAAPPVYDPVPELLALSTRHFEDGQREMREGHLLAARAQFDRALEVLMEPPAGARTEPRLRSHFDRLVARISALEVMSLAQGDGFAEQRTEPATIDQLLAAAPAEPGAPTPETKQTVEEDLGFTTYDIPIPLNARVLAFVELFSGRLKTFLEEGLSRGTRYLPMVQAVFRAEGLPLDLAYVPLVESAFKPSALSRTKARGIWQFMRGTGLENGLKHDWYIDERADPEKATRAAARYLRTLYDKFGDWHLALASYNGGPGRVQRAMDRSRRDDFWSLSASSRYLPRETRDYVPLILAAVIMAKNPAQYGLTVTPVETPDTESVTLASAVDLRRVAEWASVPVDVIQDLNPELRRWTTPLRETEYELKVPAGAAEVVRTRLSEATDELAPLNRHVVRKGETLATIARALQVSRADLAEANYLTLKARLVPGQQLIVPRAPALLASAVIDRTAPADEPVRAVASGPDGDEAPAPATGSVRARLVHRVRRGETLFSISKQYGATVASVREWNRLRSNTITVGQRLTIYRSRAAAAD